MVPFLLPFAIGLMVVLALGLVVFLRFYHVATPAKALVRSDGGGVLLRGGAFGGASAFEELVMAEREVRVKQATGEDLVVTLRPKEDEASIRAIAKELGCAVANDDARLGAVVARALEGVALEGDATAAVQRALDGVAPGFAVVSARAA